VRKLFDVAHRVVFGAEPAELSMLHFLFYSHAGGSFRRLLEIEGGAQHERFVEGAQEISQRMADRLGDAVVLGAQARAISHGDDGVVVRTDHGSFVGRRAIVAVPPALVGRIAFEPALPAGRQQLLARLPMGSTAKVVVAYERAFWRAAGFSGEVVCADGPLTVVFDNTSHEGAQPALVCFLCGRDGRAWARRAEPERRDLVLSSLARYFGSEALAPAAYVEKIWDADPFAGGCPVASPGPGVLTGFADALRDPVGRIHWAGTETAAVWNGYMEGALESGERAAHEVLARR
jgi:monoamine oxidase